MSAVPPHVLFATFVRAARFFPRAGDGDHHERTADARLAGARRSSRAARLRRRHRVPSAGDADGDGE